MEKKYPEGHFIGLWTGLGIAIFSGVGIPLSIISGNPGCIGIGPAIGAAIGITIGSSIECKYRQQGKIRPLTKEEKKNKKLIIAAGAALFVLGLIFFLLRLFR